MANRRRRARRGALVVLAAVLICLMFVMVALAVDTGYMLLVRTQMQCAVDSAAMAGASVLQESPQAAVSEAQRFAHMHVVAGKRFDIPSSQISVGGWDANQQSFGGVSSGSAALRVRGQIDEQPLFFGRAAGRFFFSTSSDSVTSVEAVALAKPRDIAFVIDLSGSANDDTEFASGRNGATPSSRDYLQELFDDLNFGTYPGEIQPLGGDPSSKTDEDLFAKLIEELRKPYAPADYQIVAEDSPEVVLDKTYRWIVNEQIAKAMPNAVPSPSSGDNFAYWKAYVDYVIVGSKTAPKGKMSGQLMAFRNSKNQATYMRNQIGYLTYVQFMLDVGTTEQVAGRYVPLSTRSSDCPLHPEDTPFGVKYFPPRVEPEHSIRQTVMYALGLIKSLNSMDLGSDYRDKVCIIGFNRADGNGTQVLMPLTGEYEIALEACTTMQCISDVNAYSAPQFGLSLTHQHLLSAKEGGMGRDYANKLVYLIMASKPDAYSCTDASVSDYISQHHDDSFFSSDNSIPQDAALMEVSKMRLKKWQVVPSGISKAVSDDFLKRLSKVSYPKGEAIPKISTPDAPKDYEPTLKRVIHDSQKRQFRLVN